MRIIIKTDGLIDGFSDIEKTIRLIEEKLNAGNILDDAAAALFARTKARFLKEVDPEGKPWEPSAAGLRRKRMGRGGGTLFDTGRLFHSMQLYAPDDHSRDIGTDVWYAEHHQEGTNKQGIVREFLGISEDDAEMIHDVVLHRIDRLLDELVSTEATT